MCIRDRRIVEGTNSGQTLGGSYSKKIIARKEDVRVTWEGLTAEESAAIGKIDASTYGKLTYYSPSKGKFLTKTMPVSYTHLTSPRPPTSLSGTTPKRFRAV